MAVQLVSRDPQLSFRDFQHANLIYNQYDFALAPKTKFLFHTVFELTPEAQSFTFNGTAGNLKELGVLCKSADLPQYVSQVETKNQYNRKKHIQTRIDYQDCTITWHDDNTNYTRQALYDYYAYYFMDGGLHKNGMDASEYDPRDKYSNATPPTYGLDNGKNTPFFKSIKIYQLHKKKWAAYTLVNPLIVSWGHDTMDVSDGAGIAENKLQLRYEAVIYNEGDISEAGEPTNFAELGVNYDPEYSSLVAGTNSGILNRNAGKIANTAKNIFQTFSQPQATGNSILDFVEAAANTGSALKNLVVPNSSNNRTSTLSSLNIASERSLDPNTIGRKLLENGVNLDTTVRKALATGSYGPQYNSSNFSDFDFLSNDRKQAIRTEILGKVFNSDPKTISLASNVLSTINNPLEASSSNNTALGATPNEIEELNQTFIGGDGTVSDYEWLYPGSDQAADEQLIDDVYNGKYNDGDIVDYQGGKARIVQVAPETEDFFAQYEIVPL